ncbi:MAG: HPr family phosphocarrier protein [Selenomonadaceae bacterium]|nr:HPr family phosphocarrier protein [Selenomonadaceae bacterium]
MARKIKFPLKMADGAEVRTLDELKEHFDVESVVGYFSDGRLLNWLRTRYYDDEADKIEQLTASDSELHKKICEIFGVESEAEIDPEEIARRQERLNRLKQYTDDRDILERVDQVAFDQEELSDLLDEDATLIYLCNNRFTIPLRVTDKTYVGIGKAIAVIRSNKIVDFDALNIKFKGVRFDDDYDAIFKEHTSAQTPIYDNSGSDSSRAEKLFKEGREAYKDDDFKTAMKKYKEAAELGYPEAFSQIGFMYQFGQSVDPDIYEARRWYKRGMEKDDADSFGLYALTLTRDDNATESDKREAFRYMKRATELAPDDGHYWYYLGKMYRFGSGTNKNLYEAFNCFKQGHKVGNSRATNQLGIMFSNGEHVEQNSRKAFDFFRKAVGLNENNASAIRNLADCYRFGDGVAKDEYKAFELFKKAAELGNVGAMTVTGVMLLNGEGTREDTEQFFYWTKKAADNGDSSAMGNLGYHFKYNIGNYSKAFDWYERAANAGDTVSMNELGDMYFDGQGVRENKSKAFQWYLRSAQNGDFDGMANVGTCYLYGNGTTENSYEGERWLKKSAEGGSLLGMYFYGDWLYDQGNTRAGISWFERAANEGLEAAQEKLAEIRNEMNQPSGGVWEAMTMIRNRQGMHARPASIFVQKASSFKSKIQLKAKGKTCDAKSILMIMSIGLEYGDQVTILAEGPDARQAVNELRNLIDSGFGE